MPQLNRWFPVAVAAIATGLCFSPSSANALTLKFGNTTLRTATPSPVPSGGSATLTYSGVLTDSQGQTADLTATLRAQSGNLATSTGFVRGVMLNLTSLNLTATGSGLFDPGAALEFSSDFVFDFTATPTVTAQQVLSGSFLGNPNQVNPTNTGVTFSSTVTSPEIDASTGDGLVPVTLGALIAQPPVGYDQASFLFGLPTLRSTANPNTTSNQLDNPMITGRLTNIKLLAGQTLSLPNSACFVIADVSDEADDRFTAQEAEEICNISAAEPQPVPEASTPLAMLAFGSFGLFSFLKRRQSSQIDLD